jgi:dihydrofolate reductase
MTQLVLKMSISVDGFVAGPNGELNWLFNSMDDAATAWILDTLKPARAHVMGSRVFQDMAAFWPTSTEPFASSMNAVPKVVFSHRGLATAPATPEQMASWRTPIVANGADVPGEIARLKREIGGPLFAHGGVRFAQALVRAAVVDEYQLFVHPVVLGRGQPLFGTLDAPLGLTLVDVTPFPSGAAAHVYRPR